jgi:hypothetical protein
MRTVALSLAGCQSKAAEVKQLQDQYNVEYPAYARDCIDPETAGAARMLTGEKLTTGQMGALEAKNTIHYRHGNSHRPGAGHQDDKAYGRDDKGPNDTGPVDKFVERAGRTGRPPLRGSWLFIIAASSL